MYPYLASVMNDNLPKRESGSTFLSITHYYLYINTVGKAHVWSMDLSSFSAMFKGDRVIDCMRKWTLILTQVVVSCNF